MHINASCVKTRFYLTMYFTFSSNIYKFMFLYLFGIDYGPTLKFGKIIIFLN